MRYTLNTTLEQVEQVVGQLTAKGRQTMEDVGNHRTSFFDEGIVEHSGIWGECLTQELGHKSSGVINRLLALDLWYHCPAEEQDGEAAGGWWSLTALGADVANYLAGNLEVDAPVAETPTSDSKVEMRDTGKYLRFFVDGKEVGLVRKDVATEITAFLTGAR